MAGRWPRGKARVNRTVAALMARGMDSATAEALKQSGHTLATLQQASEPDLQALGLSAAAIAGLRAGGRPDIPLDNLLRVLWANRWTCCVCREQGRAIIVHHIKSWARSRDHSSANLAVLCLEHHARAHTRGDLEQNLTETKLIDAKARWEDAVSQLDAKAILEASRLPGFDWWWFNHGRIFRLARHLGVELSRLPGYRALTESGFLTAEGAIAADRERLTHVYHGGEGIHMHSWMQQILERVLKATALFNISDDLDRGLLARIVRPGDVLLVQGRHYFRQQAKISHGPGQITHVLRRANGVQVSYVIDRWESGSVSAWGHWLIGNHGASSVVRVMDITSEDGILSLKCSGLALGAELEGLATRSYLSGLPDRPVDDDLDEEDFWLNPG